MRLLIIHENLSKPYDEGMKNYVIGLIKKAKEKFEVLTITNKNNNDPKIKFLKLNQLFLDFKLFKEISLFNPDCILYIPHSSITFFAFLRAKILKIFTNKKIVVISLQERRYSVLEQIILPLLKPSLVITSSEESLKILNKLRFNTKLKPIGIDTNKFKSINIKKKNTLKEKWAIPKNKNIFLHVGHLKKKRNINRLLRILEDKDNFLILVVSTSYKKELNLVSNDNLLIIDRYISNIEEIYQLSDYYLFLATKFNSAIDVPLSVLEALACDIKVITTNFGGLRWMFNNKSKNLFIIPESEDILDFIKSLKSIKLADSEINKYDSNIVFDDILGEIKK